VFTKEEITTRSSEEKIYQEYSGERERGVEGLVPSSGRFGCKGSTELEGGKSGVRIERAVKLDTKRPGIHHQF